MSIWETFSEYVGNNPVAAAGTFGAIGAVAGGLLYKVWHSTLGKPGQIRDKDAIIEQLRDSQSEIESDHQAQLDIHRNAQTEAASDYASQLDVIRDSHQKIVDGYVAENSNLQQRITILSQQSDLSAMAQVVKRYLEGYKQYYESSHKDLMTDRDNERKEMMKRIYPQYDGRLAEVVADPNSGFHKVVAGVDAAVKKIHPEDELRGRPEMPYRLQQMIDIVEGASGLGDSVDSNRTGGDNAGTEYQA